MRAPPITISDWRQFHQTRWSVSWSRLCQAVYLPDVAMHCREGIWWDSPASKIMIEQDGTELRDEADKIRYVPIVSFRTKTGRQRFNTAVITVLHLTHPEVFAGSDEAA